MAVPIKPRRSNTAGAVPTTAQLADGEVAVNTADKIIYQRVGGVVVAVAAVQSLAGYQPLSQNLTTLASPSWTPEVSGKNFNLSGADATEISLGVKNTGGGTAVFHYYFKSPTTSFAPLGQLVGGAGSRPWSGSDYSDHSTAAYHLVATEAHTATAQGTDFRIVATPIGGTQVDRITVACFNGDGDIVNALGLTQRKVSPIERGRGIEVVRNGAAEISMVGSEPSGYSTLFRGYSFGGGNIAAPQATPANNGTGFAFCGHDGSNWTNAKAVLKLGSAAAAWTQTSTPTYIDFETTQVGSTARTLRARVMDNGAFFLANSSARADNPIGGVYLSSEGGVVKIKSPSGVVKEVSPDRSSVQANRGAASVSLTPATYATVVYDVENLDSLSEYNPATGVFSPASAGLYMVQASCHLSGLGASAEVVLRVRSNGTEVARVYNMIVAGGGNIVANGTAIVQLPAGASVDVQVYVASGTPSILADSAKGTRLGVQRLA